MQIICIYLVIKLHCVIIITVVPRACIIVEFSKFQTCIITPIVKTQSSFKMDNQPSSPSPTFQTDNCHDNCHNKRLLACYLLVSHASSRAPRTYIGFTVNPSRRLKQHNGLIKCGGAYRTKKHRPWYNVAVIHGFISKTQALQFEWAWQHPHKSVILKHHSKRPGALPLPTTKKTSVNGALQTLASLVSVPPWSLCPLTLTICAERPLWQQYGIESLSLPPAFRITFAALQSFDSFITTYDYRHSSDSITPQSLHSDCPVCHIDVHSSGRKATYCASCGSIFHLACLATLRVKDSESSLLPTTVTCKVCRVDLHWSLVVRLAHVLESDDD